MKAWHAVLVIVAIIAFGLVGVKVYQVNQANLDAKAKAEFERQLQNNWGEIVRAVNLIPVRLESRKQLRDFAAFTYKRIDAVEFRGIDARYSSEAQSFMDTVYVDAKQLFKLLSTNLKSSTVDTIINQANLLDTRLRNFGKNHSDYKQPDTMVGVVLDSKLRNLVKREEIATAVRNTPKIVYAYPSWVATPTQQYAWDTMRSITADYFRERRNLSARMRWDIAKYNSSYLQSPEVQATLSGAISIRQQMLTRISNAESIEGMSSLGAQLRTMLQNSISGLQYAKGGDYATFKAYNNQNDRIQYEVRRMFGIR